MVTVEPETVYPVTGTNLVGSSGSRSDTAPLGATYRPCWYGEEDIPRKVHYSKYCYHANNGVCLD